MTRPTRTNRDDVASHAVNLRITPPEREALEALARHQQAQLDGMGVAMQVSTASVLRSLIQQRAKEVFGGFPVRQGELPFEPKPEPVAVVAPEPEPLPEPKHSTPLVPDADKLRKRLNKAIESGKVTSQAAVAKNAGVDSGAVSRFLKGQNMIDAKRMAVAAALDRMGA
jgi:hypothetical protein